VIQGNVTEDGEPVVRIVVRDSGNQDHEHEAIVDTGFTGWLTLPPDLIASLNLSWREWGIGILADGSQVVCNVYDATLLWDGLTITIPVDEADAEPLVGMRLMKGYRILIEDRDGGLVQIERL
jgi:clan AA aspartic protease